MSFALTTSEGVVKNAAVPPATAPFKAWSTTPSLPKWAFIFSYKGNYIALKGISLIIKVGNPA